MAFNRSDAEIMSNMGLGSDADHIVCFDGFELNIQAGPLYYSLPENNSMGPWTHFEVSAVSESDEDLLPFINFKHCYETGNICYREVPVEALRKVLSKHGGPRYVKRRDKSKPLKMKTNLIMESLGYGWNFFKM